MKVILIRDPSHKKLDTSQPTVLMHKGSKIASFVLLWCYALSCNWWRWTNQYWYKLSCECSQTMLSIFPEHNPEKYDQSQYYIKKVDLSILVNGFSSYFLGICLWIGSACWWVWLLWCLLLFILNYLFFE